MFVKMARSKFPGKPSKPVNKTRVNVLPSSTSEGETNPKQNSSEVKQDDCDSGIDTVQTASGSVKSTVRHCQSTRRTARKKRVCKSLMARKSSLSKRKRLGTTSTGTSSQKLKNGVNEASQSTSKKTDKRSEKKLSNGRKLTKVKQSHLESSNLVGKFVLPSRSVHSSRVIKPNKRFINVEAVNSVQLRTFKKRVVNKKNSSIKADPDNSCKSKYVSQLDSSECKRDPNNTFTQKNVDTPIARTPCSNRRIILRQARLQLHTQTPTGPEGPFSSSISSSSVSPPGTVTCGVCGAVRFYRFVKQARKFNIYSCESCRKFISKMIKRQVCNKKLPEIQCLKGQGMCHVPPIVRSQHWKFRCAYKARCNACWLKMCLRSFQMPASLKNSLINLLPDFMQESDTLFHNSLSLFSFHTNPNIDSRSSSMKSPSLSSISLNNKVDAFPLNRRPVRKKIVKSVERSSGTHPASDIKRQKIDLKGPRVKHVCRSASIVLGQPLAIFPDDSDKKQSETADIQNKPVSIKSESFTFENDTSENKENNSAIDNKGSNSKLENIETSRESEQVLLKNVSSKIDFPSSTTTVPKRERDKNNKQALPPTCTIEAKSRKRHIESEHSIYIDFWENYDPEEVCRSGFGLIASVSFPMPAICFLCGSAGRDPLIFCCLCCEPYHPFCLEPAPKNLKAHDQCYDWLCPRCTTCNACGEADKQKLNCQKCYKAYHPECFNTKWQTDDRPTVCSSCLRCKSCGTNNITKFIGNTPLCLMCFRLRKKGNFCPLCQRCYDDNDYDTKMMECGKCNMWIHAKCEGLSEEQYQILSLLPESTEFLCCICETLPFWRKAVDSELRASFGNVLRLLSKNRIARNILKWSPMCFSPPNNKTASAVKKLQFSDESELSDISGDENNVETNQETTNLKKMQKKYKLKELRVTIKPCTVATDEVYLIPEDKSAIKTPITPSLTDIKNKLHSNEYLSLREFNDSMEEILETAKSAELLEIYHSILKQVFPWYNSTQVEADCSNISFCDASRTDLATSEDTLQNVLDNYKHKMINNIENDSRICAFCKGVGDGLCYREARLLYCGNNEWVHANCALWSSEVYEEIDGSLQNVHSAVTRGRLMRCSYCKQKGASIGCCAKNCHETYHFSCAHTVKCYFMHDKSIYCPSHGVINSNAVISSSSDFALRRSVYVELDKMKKRYIEPKNVQFMVGSLCVTNLGVFVPVVSDNSEAIIPSSLSCRRLFWSTVEPWKLIPYVITTRVLSAQSSNAITDRNFTVDHTLSKLLVEKKLKEILIWQKDLEKTNFGSTEFEDEEEPQNENAADILSPELTDAILEELPHEFLDGISMQDIFPKLMSNEELLGIDFKVGDVANAELCKNDTIVPLTNEQNKKAAFFEDPKDICDSISDIKNVRELKDNKSEAFQHVHNVNKISKIRNHQRSCSVTLSCKVDNSLATPTKQLKAVSQEKSVYLQLLQVDGAYDNSSSSDCESTAHEIEDLWTPDILDQPVKCERCQCTYRTQASYKRHLESCEVISTSESDSEVSQEQEQPEMSNSNAVGPSTCDAINTELMSITQNKVDATEPYVVASYESYSTYQTTQNEVHSSTLNTQTLVSAESAAEVVSVPQSSELFFSNFQPVMEHKALPTIFTSQSINPSASIPINQPPTITISQPSNTSVCEPTHVTINGTQALSINQQHSSLPVNQISQNQSNELCISQPPPLYISQPSCSSMVNQPGTISILQSAPLPVNHTPISINQAGAISLNTSSTPLHINQPVEIQSQQLTIQSVPITQEVAPVLNIAPSNQITINTKMLAAPNVVNSMVTQAVTVPHNQFVKPVLKPTVVSQKSVRPRGRPRSLAAKRTRPLESRTIFVPQGTPGGPSVVVQQLPSTSMIPTFLEAFQQQTGQNLQYITTITPQITSAVTNQPQIVQLQPEGTLVNLVSGVQPAVILPQPRVLSDQIIVDNNGSLMWASQPVQPIFYGFETIVQNTVLQSQQFLPSAVPGVLTANSSYSSTTQVFQTSKLEPILDVSSGNIVLLNSSPVVNSQPLQVPQNVSNHLPPTPLVISESKPAVSWSYLDASADPSSLESHTKALPSTISTTNITANNSCSNNSINNIGGSSSSINLPVAPFVPEPGIPTNIVTPTPKPITTAAQLRPMNRVLPMPTNNPKQNIKTAVKNVVGDKPATVQICRKSENQTANLTNKPQKITILDEVILKPVLEPNALSNEKTKPSKACSKEETTSLKLVFQKQREGGVYKISNSFNLKNTSSIQIAPLKPIKAKTAAAQNRFPLLEQNTSEKNTITTMNSNKQGTKAEPKLLHEKQESAMVYTVETHDGYHYSSTSVSDLWAKVFEAVQAARIAHNMPPLPSGSLNMMNNLQILGLKTNGLKYLLEQLPGASKCTKYKRSFHKETVEVDVDEDLLVEHTHVAARFIPHVRSNEPSDMFGWLASKHRTPPPRNPSDSEQHTRRGSVNNLPMAMRFRHLKPNYKQYVGVYRSTIHKRGLFCLKDIEGGEMVIEYAGEVIRSVLADKREKKYTSKGMGCYMFRIDENFVVDATMMGNAARFINHSCEPNCYSKVVEILGHKHIIIFALRKILRGEELTYDYKFPFEEDKIPCTCGSRRCRKFLN